MSIYYRSAIHIGMSNVFIPNTTSKFFFWWIIYFIILVPTYCREFVQRVRVWVRLRKLC
jgi:hypothetical protein